MKNSTLYVDMDGTLCVFDTMKTIEEIASPGYFRTVKPMKNMISAIKMVSKIRPVRILSAVINENVISDKRFWLSHYLGEEFAKNAIFISCGKKKSSMVSKNDNVSFLLDDFSKNLHEWKSKRRVGIKVYNGINGTNGTWNGYSVHSDSTTDCIYKQLLGIMSEETK